MGSVKIWILFSLLLGVTCSMVEAGDKVTVKAIENRDDLQNCFCDVESASAKVDNEKKKYNFKAQCACDVVEADPIDSFKSDVVFLIETSGRVSEDNLEKMKFFAKNIMRTIKSGKDEKAFWSVLSFAEKKTKPLAWLKQCKVLKRCMQGVDRVETAGGEPNIGKAVKYALKFSFKTRFGRGAGSKKVLLFVGSGDTTEKETAVTQLARAKAEKVDVYYVAIDGKVDKAWLESSFPENTHLVVNADDLSKKTTLDWVRGLFN